MKVFRWGSRALDMFPEDNALHKTYNFEGKVIIIGAGASGLAAAKILQRNNIDYLILNSFFLKPLARFASDVLCDAKGES